MTERPKVLVLDDSKLLLEWTHDVLTDAGYSVETAETVFAARQLAERGPDLILMDVHFTEVFQEGVAATRAIKRDQETAHVPVVLYSALDPDILLALATDCGADGFIRKSDNPTDLIQLITYFLFAADELSEESAQN